MVKLSESCPPVVTRADGEEREDLVRDLEALREPGQSYPPASATCTRPAILRRLATRAAQQVGPDTDRLVATVQDSVLAAAISLHTGVPFALTEGSRLVTGDLHKGERAVFVAYHLDPSLVGEQADLATEHELELGGRVAVFAEQGPETDATTEILFESLSSPLDSKRA